MNDGTRKAANALVAVVDFFAGSLALEAQTRDGQERMLQQLSDQLRDQSEVITRLKGTVAELENTNSMLRDSRCEADKQVVILESSMAILLAELDTLKAKYEAAEQALKKVYGAQP